TLQKRFDYVTLDELLISTNQRRKNMIHVLMNDDVKVFNIKTFRDPLSNIIEMNFIEYTELKKFSSLRKKSRSLPTSSTDSDFVKIWNPRSAKR
ncbi:MAG: hypothetical protein WBL80_08415, partial [Erysipelotrichaceae bacterium]